jgi:hypothetical protein
MFKSEQLPVCARASALPHPDNKLSVRAQRAGGHRKIALNRNREALWGSAHETEAKSIDSFLPNQSLTPGRV